jgi:hypothetical protein
MKSFLKMAFPVLVLLFIMSNDGRPVHILQENKIEIRAQHPPPPPPDFRNLNPPADFDEIRKQRNIERSLNTEWLKESTKKYSPDSWYLLMSYDSLPSKSSAPLLNGGVVTSEKTNETFGFLRGRTRIDLLVSMETNVHEIAHSYFDQNTFRYLIDNQLEFNPDNANGFIYITPGLGYFISFPFDALFPSANLASAIPKNLRTYRYDTYIAGTTSTQSDGIIGLLNELHAYYCGSRFCFDMLEPFKEAAGSEPSGLFEWVTHTQSTMSAFYEFDFYISEYLLYMKRKYPANYEQLISYRPFTETYVTLKALYSDLINRYLDRINSEMNLMNSNGEAEVRLKDGWLWIRSTKSHISSGTPLFSDERQILLPLLEGKRYNEIRGDLSR